MDLSTILDVNVIQTGMKVKNKEEAIYELSNLLLKEKYITDIEVFMKDVYVREGQGQTGVGNYISIPHGRSDAVSKVGVAIGILEDEIEWESLDGKGVKGVILFAVGNDTEGAMNHLKLLSSFARKLGNDEVIEQLLAANNKVSVIEAFA